MIFGTTGTNTGRFALLAAVIFAALPVRAQLVIGTSDSNVTIEAYANSSASIGAEDAEEGIFVDGAVRVLGVVPLAASTKFGARAVMESDTGSDTAKVTERSLLLLHRWGRLEFGRRQGLPDVLTGYAPNNFTFTTAEFGPASGRSLDPAGGLVSAFLDDEVALRFGRLSTLGFAASMFDDRSEKLIYVSPKWHGFLGGASYSHDAGSNDDAVGELLQLGLTHERYAGLHVIRYGGSFSQANGRGGHRRLRSLNSGLSATLNDSWLLGLSATYESMGGNDARGVVTSVNYNRGAWTWGGFLQWAEADTGNPSSGRRQLHAAEAGLSYRSSQQLRWFAGYNQSRLTDSSVDFQTADVGVLVFGVRVAL